MRVIVLFVVFAACYSPGYRDCEITCAANTCPDGLTCNAGVCRTPGAQGTCSSVTPDAAVTCSTGLTACGTECVELTTVKHCGRCDRDCGSQSACTGGVCEAVTLRPGLRAPSMIAASQNFVAYGEGEYVNCIMGAAVSIMDVGGGAGAGFTIATCASTVAFGPGTVYIADIGRVRSFTLTGQMQGTASFTMGQYVGGVVADSSTVYAGVHNPDYGIYRMDASLNGSMGLVLSRSPRKPGDIVRTPNHLWYMTRIDPETIRHVDRMDLASAQGGEVSFVEGPGSSLAFGGGRVFVGERAGQGRLLTGDPDTAQLSPIVTATPGILDVAADDAGVYWAQVIPGGGTQLWGRRHDTMTLEMLVQEQFDVAAIAVDGSNLFWLTIDPQQQGALRRVAK